MIVATAAAAALEHVVVKMDGWMVVVGWVGSLIEWITTVSGVFVFVD